MFRNISWFNDMTQQRNPVAKFLNKSKGDQCLLKYSQLFSKVINASSNILKYSQRWSMPPQIFWSTGSWAAPSESTSPRSSRSRLEPPPHLHLSLSSPSRITVICIKFTNTIMNNIIIITNAISWCLPRALSQDLSRSKRSSAALQWGFKGEHFNT